MAQQTFANLDTAATVRSKLNNNANDVAAHHASSINPHSSTLVQTNLVVTGTATFSDGNLVKSITVDSGSMLFDHLQLLSGRRIDIDISGNDITVAYILPAEPCTIRFDPAYPGIAWTAQPAIGMTGYGGRNYYEWSSVGSVSIGHFIARIPDDFSAWDTSSAIALQSWTDACNTTSYVDVEIFCNSTSCATASFQQGSGSWLSITFGSSDLGSWSPGDLFKMKVSLAVSAHATTQVARIGELVWQYIPS